MRRTGQKSNFGVAASHFSFVNSFALICAETYLHALDYIELPDDPEVARQLTALQRRQRGHGGPDDVIVACGGAALLALGAIEPLKKVKEYA